MKEIEVLVLGKVFLGKNTGNSVANPFSRNKGLPSPSIAYLKKKSACDCIDRAFFEKMGC